MQLSTRSAVPTVEDSSAGISKRIAAIASPHAMAYLVRIAMQGTRRLRPVFPATAIAPAHHRVGLFADQGWDHSSLRQLAAKIAQQEPARPH